MDPAEIRALPGGGLVERGVFGHDTLFCGYEDLLKMKAAAGREQDKVDIRTLRAQRHDLS